MKLKHGSYEVNPPFVPAILTASAQHMLQQLQDAEAAGGALGFVVLMPGWREVPGWRLLHGSCFLKQSLLVAAADHGACSLDAWESWGPRRAAEVLKEGTICLDSISEQHALGSSSLHHCNLRSLVAMPRVSA
jgi:hypothetical protein